MHIEGFSKTGTFHRENKQENQDHLFSIEDDDHLAIMLADGATACEKGGEGARLSCEAMAEVIRQEGHRFFDYPKEKIAYLMKEQILYYLERCKSEEEDIREYGSTFAIAYIDKKTGRTVAADLGDGAVFTVDENGFSYLLRPVRYSGAPCLTTVEDADKDIRIREYYPAEGESILICSDGFLDQMSKENVASLLNNNDIKGLKRQLSETENSDDCSFIAITI